VEEVDKQVFVEEAHIPAPELGAAGRYELEDGLHRLYEEQVQEQNMLVYSHRRWLLLEQEHCMFALVGVCSLALAYKLALEVHTLVLVVHMMVFEIRVPYMQVWLVLEACKQA
jgi:hypothetical protein